MYRSIFLGMCGVTAMLTGCARYTNSEAPVATNFAAIEQQKTQSAAHWNLIAADVVKRLKPAVGNNTVYVAAAANESTFAKAFRGELITGLVNASVPVNKFTSGSQLTVEVETQLVMFSADRYQNRRFYSASAIAAGIWGLHGLDIYPQTNFILGSVGLAAVLDWHNWYDQEFAKGPTPQYELIVTTSISDATRFVGRSTDVYYISDGDNQLYRNAVTAYTLNLKGDK